MSAPTPSSCFMDCMTRFADECQSIVFNAETQNCVPGTNAFRPLGNLNTSIPSNDSLDTIFYAVQPIPACNTNDNFALYTYCGTTVCLRLSTSKIEYDLAKADCDQLSTRSRLFLPKSAARFSVFFYVGLTYVQQNTWVPLSDRDEENTWVWEDGDLVTEQQSSWVWIPGYPISWGEEDCAEVRHRDYPGLFGSNDCSCTLKKFYMCEPY